MLQSIKNNYHQKILSFLIIGSFVYSVFYNMLFFRIENSPDYLYYSSYIELFFNIVEASELEQGLIYHFLVSLILSFSEGSINAQNFLIYASNSIHLLNSIFFLIGLFGLNHLLKFYRIDSKDRKLIILLTIFLPFIIQARLHYKPEIVAIAFIPWILFNYLEYMKEKKIKNLFMGLTILSGTVFLKGNIFSMLGVFIFLLLLNDIKKISKVHFVKGFIFFSAITIPLLFENQKFNGLTLFKNTGKRLDSGNYQDTVSLEFFTNFSFYKYIRKPNLDPENVNFYSTILGDTFSDFFGVSWNTDHFPMQVQYDLFENWILNGLFNFSEYYIGFVLSIFFYALLVFNVFSNRNKYERIFYAAPFIGICILFLNALGFPFENFNSSQGDTFKSIYYSFLLFISFIYISKNSFSKLNKAPKILIVLFFIIFTSFSLGINTEIFKNPKFVEKTEFVLQNTPICKLGTLIDFNLLSVECNPPSDFCSEPRVKDNYNKKNTNDDGTYTFYEDGAFGEIYLISSTIQDIKLVKGFDECYHYQSLGYDQPYRFNNLRFPIFNILLFISILGVVIYNSFFEKLKL